MSWYRHRVERDLKRWQAAGWVSDTGAAAIEADLKTSKSPFSAAPILAVLGAVLFGFAVMSFVAANWSAMSKLTRLLLLLVTLWGCYGAAAALIQRQLQVFAGAAILGGIAVYGASIMLIAQMYHMEGNPPDAILMWALGALLAAVLLQSNAALAATFVLISVWTCWERGLAFTAHWPFLIVWVIATAAVVWIRWRPGLHLSALALVQWLVPLGYLLWDHHAHWVVLVVGLAVAAGAAAGAEHDRSHLADIGAAVLLRPDRSLRRALQHAVHRGPHLLRIAGRAIHPASRAARHPGAGHAARRDAVGDQHGQPRRAVAGLHGLRHRDLHALRAHLRHAAQHLAVFPNCRAAGERARLGRLPAASAQDADGSLGMITTLPSDAAAFIRNRVMLMVAIVALIQTGVLAGMVVDRTRLLKSGREITLPIVPVDPRDLFKGEYVRLAYEASNVPARLLDGPPPKLNRAFYVVLEKKEGGAWQPVKMSRALPSETSPDRIVLKARNSTRGWPVNYSADAIVRVRYGIESYFVPEGDGPRLEQLARDKKLAALVAVDRGGNAAIKGIVIDGKLQYEEPLF